MIVRRRIRFAKPLQEFATETYAMGRWPENTRSVLTTFLLIFVLFPALAWLCWWFVRG